MGEHNDNITAGEVRRRLHFRAILSVAGIIAFGACGLIAIGITAGHINGDLVVFILGVAALIYAGILIIGWGSSSNQGLVAHLVGDGFANVEEIERDTGKAIVIALDDLRRLRELRERRQG